MSRWRYENPSKRTAYMREWVETDAGKEYKKKRADQIREWRLKNPERFHATQKRAYDKMRQEVLEHYSNGDVKCICCGERKAIFLQIDHIAGNGSDHRREIKAKGQTLGGNSFVYWLKKNGFPEGFQILCANCNYAKRQKPECPCKDLI